MPWIHWTGWWYLTTSDAHYKFMTPCDGLLQWLLMLKVYVREYSKGKALGISMTYVTQLRSFHGNVNIAVIALCQVYWIPYIWKCVKNILQQCVQCRGSHTILKTLWVLEASPSTVTRVDFIGGTGNYSVHLLVHVCSQTSSTLTSGNQSHSGNIFVGISSI